jgi:WD40 repeat protein
VCERRVNALAMLRTRPVLAYACQDGEVGLRGLADGALVAQVSDGNAAIALAVSADDRYVVFGGQHGVLRIYDAATDRFASYKGQIACLDAVAAPSAAFPYVAAGDDDGTLRVWAPPTPVARTVISAVAMLYDTAIFDDGTVVGAGGDRELRWWRNGQGGAVAAHDGGAIALRRSRDGAHVASFGFDGDIVLWDARMAPLRRMHAGPLTSVAFLADGASLVSTGEDGRLLWWTAETPAAQDGPAFAVQFAQPLVGVEALPWGDLVVAARGGDLWRVNPAGERQRIRQGRGEAMVHLIASSDGRWLGIGTSAGEVSVFSTATWEALPVLTADGPIRSVALSPDASLIAAVSKTGVAYLAPHPAMPAAPPPGWRQIAVPARDAKFSPDGRLLAITTNDGGALFYGLRRRQWRYIPLLAPEVFRGQFSRDGAHYATVDAAGRATLFDARQIPD